MAFLVVVVLGLAIVGSASEVALEPGKAIERSISAGDTHSYTITLTAGQYVYVTVDQRGVDVIVSVYGPDGAAIARVDSPNYDLGVEPVSLVADNAGVYRLEVKPPSSPKVTGQYQVKLEELRTATQQDRSRVAAQTLSAEGKALRNQHTSLSYHQAIEKYREALTLWRAVNDKLREAFTLHNLGLLYGDTGQYQKALDTYSQASALYKTLKLPRGEVSILSNTGYIYGELGDNQKSLETYLRVEEAYKTIGDVDSVILSNIGTTYGKLRQFDRALQYHARALAMRRAGNNLAGQAITLNNIANCYDNLGDNPKALQFYNESLALMLKNNDDYYTAATLNNLGVFFRNQKEYDKAASYLDDALKRRRTVGDRRGIATTLSNIARLERDRGNLVEARKHIEEALSLAEWLRSKVASPRWRAIYFASVQQYREFYIDLLMRLHKEKPSEQLDRAAFDASEQGRARSLLELLREASTEIRHGVDPVLLAREQSLGQSIADKAELHLKLLSSGNQAAQANAVANEIATLTTDYEQVQSQIRNTSPQYAALTQPVPLGLSEIQQQVVDRDTLLLEYSLGEEKSFLWAITPDSIKSYELPERAKIEAWAQRLYELLTVRNVSIATERIVDRQRRFEAADAEYRILAAALSKVLFGPVASELKDKRLLIVSEGTLQYVPFAALPDPAANDARPLIVAHEIVTAPSASVVALLRQETAHRKPASKSLAVFADPVFSRDDPRVAARGLSRTSAARSAEVSLGNLRRLRFSRHEADEIVRFADVKHRLYAVDFEANRGLATSPQLGEFRIVHFATHGLINNQHPELSGVVLSLVDEKGQSQNGFLRLYDLYNLKLSAELVVLSACQTALGKDIKGEGLVGLTRGFMYAGAPRVVASLWQIDDRASAEFMRRFYDGLLGNSLRPAAALRAAQVSMQSDDRWHAPHYWAAFTLQGEWK